VKIIDVTFSEAFESAKAYEVKGVTPLRRWYLTSRELYSVRVLEEAASESICSCAKTKSRPIGRDFQMLQAIDPD
jgi:hypothetical protein